MVGSARHFPPQKQSVEEYIYLFLWSENRYYQVEQLENLLC